MANGLDGTYVYQQPYLTRAPVSAARAARAHPAPPYRSGCVCVILYLSCRRAPAAAPCRDQRPECSVPDQNKRVKAKAVLRG